MNILRINNLITRNDTKNRLVRGKRCYNEGCVLEIKSMVDNEYGSLDIYGKVISENDIGVYDTNISIDMKNDMLIYTECNCKDFKSNCDFNSNYICKHIGASYYKFSDEVSKKLENTKKAEKIQLEDVREGYEVLLDEINSINNNKKEPVNMAINITEKYNRKNGKFFEVDFKIGIKRLYVVKSIYDLIKAKEKGIKINYGKEFVYDANYHYFSSDYNKVIAFLEEYIKLNDILESRNTTIRYTEDIFGKGKVITLSEDGVKRFLETVLHKTIDLTINNDVMSMEVTDEELPLHFEIKEKGEGIVISTNEDSPKALTSKGDVYYGNNKIYILNEKQLKYKALISVLNSNKNEVLFKGEAKQEVFNTIIPLLDIISKDIEIDENIIDNTIIDKLSLEVLFDRERNDTWAVVNCIYGNIKFNLINGPKSEDSYIIRDFKEELYIEDVLNNINFFRDKDRFIFKGDDEKLFKFLNSDLKKLKDTATIYYSDRFKDRKVYAGNSISASINEGSGNYLEFTFDIANINENEIKQILKAFRENRKFFKLKDDNFIDLEDENVSKLMELLEGLSESNNDVSKEMKVHKSKAMFLSNIINEKSMYFVKGIELSNEISEKITLIKDKEYMVPQHLNAKLRDYQNDGYKWLKTLSDLKFGGILADEMGLGKTLQVITFLLSEKGKNSIIVTPTSLIYNWKAEFTKFAPQMKVKVIHGSKEERANEVIESKKYDVILTTYGTLRNDYELYNKKKFDFCIIDEAQSIKNSNSQSSEVVKKVNSEVKFALTGTPIENNLLELWSIFDFIMPGYLYNKSKFVEKFIRSDNGMTLLKKLIEPFILRRLKKDVMMELPDKIEKRFYVDMTKKQKQIYGTFVNDIREKMDAKSEDTDKITIFSYLTKLRQLCLDPSIIVEGYDGGSGKIDVTAELLQQGVKEGRKILLFSQFTSVLSNLKKLLEGDNIKYYYIDGATKPSERINLVDKFNESEEVSVFLISLKAGGTGLNLTSADMVIHFDPWWNPAIEDQATDRAHRFGQKKIVEVIKLISKGSIEEKIIELQEKKKDIINDIMSGNFTNGGFLSSLSDDEIKDLFS